MDIHFSHPSGLEFELIGDDNDQRPPWTTSDVSSDVAVRGLHSVTLSLRETAESERLMEVLSFKKIAEEGPYKRFEIGKGGSGTTVRSFLSPDRF